MGAPHEAASWSHWHQFWWRGFGADVLSTTNFGGWICMICQKKEYKSPRWKSVEKLKITPQNHVTEHLPQVWACDFLLFKKWGFVGRTRFWCLIVLSS